MLLLLGYLFPVALDVAHLLGLGDRSGLASEGNDLWDLVAGVVLHLSELVVLLVEGDPLVIIDIDGGNLVW